MSYPIANKNVEIIQLGLIDFKEAWEFQEELFHQISDIKLANRNREDQVPTPNYLILCEHPPVYTLGKSGTEDHLLLNESELKDSGTSFYKINRGGDITYHGPGQLVVYPIFDLENFFTDIHLYLRTLEEIVIQTLDTFGIKSERLQGCTGVWINSKDISARKICAMGVKCGRWITMHGLALNVVNDMNYFNNIIACGIKDKSVTSMKQELPTGEFTVDLVSNVLTQKFASEFGISFV